MEAAPGILLFLDGRQHFRHSPEDPGCSKVVSFTAKPLLLCLALVSVPEKGAWHLFPPCQITADTVLHSPFSHSDLRNLALSSGSAHRGFLGAPLSLWSAALIDIARDSCRAPTRCLISIEASDTSRSSRSKSSRCLQIFNSGYLLVGGGHVEGVGSKARGGISSRGCHVSFPLL